MGDARNDIGGYWKSVMNEQPIPEAIRSDIFVDDQDLPAGSDHESVVSFVKDFDVQSSAIIYHSHTSKPRQAADNEISSRD